ncbi:MULTISPECIES: GNAT family N-acetyltransferase [Catenuloplanes]|uniref:RimJ/RimL family protein N-acetyltransferase n=1 Tax=Catenuloplanes niger TaxID=587534 RepID=A0AAE4CRB7_9ACTN|nr:GNAT family N-acetyltransferase [Catenuloplanes niger]MDR7319993.1 RimJ/RimL family protein N-acetyltransferase [Catenuloplanes niger]
METFLRTERLVLREFTTDDVDLVVALHSDPEVMEFLTGGRPQTQSAVVERTLPAFIRDYPDRGAWAAFDKESGAFAGWFALSPVASADRTVVDLGYRLHKATWGRGIATEGARALVDKAFRELGVERIVADTMTVNARSRRVLEKAGLRYVRTFFGEWPETIPGAEHGDVEYALDRAEWAAR